MDHKEAAKQAAEELEELEGLCKILLFGSVSRGDERPESDVDLALIFKDEMRAFPCNLSGKPTVHNEILEEVRNKVLDQYDFEIHYSRYFLSEFMEGVRLGGDPEDDVLGETGEVLYDSSADPIF